MIIIYEYGGYNYVIINKHGRDISLKYSLHRLSTGDVGNMQNSRKVAPK
jgi:hypothetical protein